MEEPVKMLEAKVSEIEEPALYSLLLVPHRAQCNSLSFEDAKDTGESYYPVFVGNAINFRTAIETFIAQAQSMKSIFNGHLPKLCGSKQIMEMQVVQARTTTLNLLFSFAFDHESPRSLNSDGWRVCKTSAETTSSISSSNFFDTIPTVSFEHTNENGHEGDGFAMLSILRTSEKTKKSVLLIQTELVNATEDDIVLYNGLVVFDINQEKLDILVQVKIDDVNDDNEYFRVSYEHISKPKGRRKKRADKGTATVKLQDQVPFSEHLKSLNKIRWTVIQVLTKQKAYWDTEELKGFSLEIISSQVIQLFKSFDPDKKNMIRMYRRANTDFMNACKSAGKLVRKPSGEKELWFSTSMKHSRIFNNQAYKDNTKDVVFEIFVDLSHFISKFKKQIVENKFAGQYWNSKNTNDEKYPEDHWKNLIHRLLEYWNSKNTNDEKYPEDHWKNLIHREILNKHNPNPKGKNKKSVDHPWGKINFATVGDKHLDSFNKCIQKINICNMVRLTNEQDEPLDEYKIKECKVWIDNTVGKIAEEQQKTEKEPDLDLVLDLDLDLEVNADPDAEVPEDQLTRRSSQSKFDLSEIE
eukprot:GFUD01062348.1.p1 GENE.GFUD01062348.1~~GFUD01062348.1.p1  ORF type:complete len:680 (+),score=126.43 GFUD01062348.1:295-2040(+)